VKSVEVKLHDNSRLTLSWICPSKVLRVELWKLGNLRDGHGWLLTGSTVLDGEQLREVVDLFLGPAIALAGTR
jgi:hypothetical protein